MPVKQGQGQGSAPEAVKVASETLGVFLGWILSCFGKIHVQISAGVFGVSLKEKVSLKKAQVSLIYGECDHFIGWVC